MAYTMQTTRERINGYWYYYLYADRKWHVFIHYSPHMFKIATNLSSLQEAEALAHSLSTKITEVLLECLGTK